MIAIADTLDPDSVALDLAATTGPEAIRETAALLRGQLPVLDWEELHSQLHKSAPCRVDAAGAFALSLPHARTDAVATMVMSVGLSRQGVSMEGCVRPVRYIFCIGVPKAMANDYLRIVGLLMRILKDQATEERLRAAKNGAEFVDCLTELELKF